MTQPRLWVIVGATGTGKTTLSLDLAERVQEAGRSAEVVNADAMQLYRGMNIGTAKVPTDERRGIPHHLFDALDVTEEATVAWYQQIARQTIAEIHDRGHDAIVIGGSGLYVSSAIYDFTFPPRDEALRAQLESDLKEFGSDSLLARLQDIDAEAAQQVDARNPRRVVRALEIALLGSSAQVVLPQRPTLHVPNTHIIGVHVDRATLVERLNTRVLHMWQQGMIEEVRALIELGLEHGKTASRAIGYAQAIGQVRGLLSEQQAIEETQMLTRRYARRQVSWFKRYDAVQWIDAPDAAAIHFE